MNYPPIIHELSCQKIFGKMLMNNSWSIHDNSLFSKIRSTALMTD